MIVELSFMTGQLGKRIGIGRPSKLSWGFKGGNEGVLLRNAPAKRWVANFGR